jgi:hypothetical protein
MVEPCKKTALVEDPTDKIDSGVDKRTGMILHKATAVGLAGEFGQGTPERPSPQRIMERLFECQQLTLALALLPRTGQPDDQQQPETTHYPD